MRLRHGIPLIKFPFHFNFFRIRARIASMFNSIIIMQYVTIQGMQFTHSYKIKKQRQRCKKKKTKTMKYMLCLCERNPRIIWKGLPDIFERLKCHEQGL